jgi:hypothetical protein
LIQDMQGPGTLCSLIEYEHGLIQDIRSLIEDARGCI